jgi:hypothetical protein
MLPKVDVPIYELALPSSGKLIKVRPFIVKEEKLLLQALESKDELQIVETTKQIVNNCLLSEDVDVEKLPFFDVDYLFIALRAKSVGESIEVSFRCNNRPDGQNKCNHVFQANIDISNIEVDNKDLDKKIALTDAITVKMKYPSYDVMKRLSDKEDTLSKKIKVVAASIDMIVEGDKVYTPKDHSKEEFEAFVEGFTEEQFKKVSNFVDNFPHFKIVANDICPKCGFNHRIEYTDFTSFFR